MPKVIHDEFDALRGKISPQQLHMLRRQRRGQCAACPGRRVTERYCLKCLVAKRERQHKELGYANRYRGALSYRLEREARND